jgi:hypothetical protein
VLQLSRLAFKVVEVLRAENVMDNSEDEDDPDFSINNAESSDEEDDMNSDGEDGISGAEIAAGLSFKGDGSIGKRKKGTNCDGNKSESESEPSAKKAKHVPVRMTSVHVKISAHPGLKGPSSLL